jgi:hypothetical protein
MIYSVWSWGKKQYDYYHTDEDPPFVPKARSLPASSIGIAPEDAAAPLPKSAVPAGSGVDAKGYIAVHGGPEGIDKSKIAIFVGLTIAAYGLWKMLKY